MRMLNADERCVVDPGRPCGACSAPGPALCPYRYLLDDDEIRSANRVADQASPDSGPVPAAA